MSATRLLDVGREEARMPGMSEAVIGSRTDYRTGAFPNADLTCNITGANFPPRKTELWKQRIKRNVWMPPALRSVDRLVSVDSQHSEAMR